MYTKMLGIFYKAVVQAVLLFGSDICSMTPHIGRTPEFFYHQMDLRMIGKQQWRGTNGSWSYPPMSEAMTEVGLEELETYFTRLQNAVAQCIAVCPILYLFL